MAIRGQNMPVLGHPRGLCFGDRQLTSPVGAHACLFVYLHSLTNGLGCQPVSAAPVDKRPGIMVEWKASLPTKGSPELQDSQELNIPCGGTHTI
mmetsp:Transcript_9721/g.58992  ORF Transcript_9721/g.58992 Transcript_9721/m.58992 type:complete len:94 (+) Transcript_9721:2427-2708(+)